MPLERSDAILDLSDPNIVLGPRKRRPTERLLENGDPLVCKKARYSSNKENHATPTMPDPGQATDRADSSNGTTSDGAQAIVVEDSDEVKSDRGSDGGETAGTDEDEGETTDEDDDAELVRLQKDWDAPIYVFFKPLPTIQYVRGQKAHVFACAASQCLCRTRIVRRFLDTSDAKSTSNLRRHAKVCWGGDAVDAADGTRDVKAARAALLDLKATNGSITAAFQRVAQGKTTYSHRQHTKTEARAEFVRWVTESNRPFQIVNDRGFRALMKTGRPDCYIPSAETLSRDVKNVFVRVRGRIAKALQEYHGKLNFATDAWSSPNHKSYVAITVHLERSGKPFQMLLDLVEVPQSHTGVNLGIAFMDVLNKFGIEEKVLSITGDNASNNDAMIQYLGNTLEDFPGPANQTRCFVHTINLIAKSILRPFDTQKTNDIRAFNDVAHALADLAEGHDPDECTERVTGANEEEVDEEDKEDKEDGEDEYDKDNDSNASLEPIRSMLLKLRKIAFMLKNSTTILLPAWYKMLAAHGLPSCMMPQDVSTRWNSTFDMLEFAIRYRVAIDAMTAAREFNLRKYELASAEWNIAMELRDIFKDATLFFSRGTPNLATVIPAMDLIDKVLTTSSKSSSEFSLAIRAALSIGKRTLDKYHNKTGESEVYRIAMILHPRHKLEYFKRNNWDGSSIEAARDIVQDEFNRSYWLVDIEGDNITTQGNRDIAGFASSEPTNMFDSLMDTTPLTGHVASSNDELQRYLATDIEDVKDGLMWWYEKHEIFPRLSQMARGYLSIPATTVDVERVFSRGRLVLPYVRSRLAVQSTRASLCVRLWSSQGLVKDADIKASLGPDNVEEENELPMNWDAIPVL